MLHSSCGGQARVFSISMSTTFFCLDTCWLLICCKMGPIKMWVGCKKINFEKIYPEYSSTFYDSWQWISGMPLFSLLDCADRNIGFQNCLDMYLSIKKTLFFFHKTISFLWVFIEFVVIPLKSGYTCKLFKNSQYSEYP